MARLQRQLKILEIIKQLEIDTQEELVEQLANNGYTVTQATVSRDIKELGLIKVASSNEKKYKYAYVETKEHQVSSKYVNLFKEAVVDMKSAGNMIVIKTITGSANSACAFIDKLGLSSILGSIAGDDTIIMVIDNPKDADGVIDVLKSYVD